jgi:hypothetical protein
MDTRSTWRPLLTALTYPVQFESDPLDGLDRVMAMVVGAAEPLGSRADFLAAVRGASAYPGDLAALLDLPYPDARVRAFLAALEQRLEG